MRIPPAFSWFARAVSAPLSGRYTAAGDGFGNGQSSRKRAKGNNPREGDQGKLAYLKWPERAEKGTSRYKGEACSRIVSTLHALRYASFHHHPGH